MLAAYQSQARKPNSPSVIQITVHVRIHIYAIKKHVGREIRAMMSILSFCGCQGNDSMSPPPFFHFQLSSCKHHLHIKKWFMFLMFLPRVVFQPCSFDHMIPPVSDITPIDNTLQWPKLSFDKLRYQVMR